MKKVLLFALAFSMLGFSSFAQDEEPEDPFAESERKPKKGIIGVGLNINGLFNLNNFSNGAGVASINGALGDDMLFIRYYLANDLVVRLGFGITSRSTKANQTDSTNPGTLITNNTPVDIALISAASSWGQVLYTGNEQSKQLAFTFAPGIEKHFKGTDKLDPFVGAQINLSILGKQKQTNSYAATGDFIGTAESITIDEVIETPGGTNFGLGIFTGFHYFFAKNIALGAEARLMYNSTSTGGDITSTTTITTTGTTPSTTVVSSPSTNKTSTSGFAATTFGGAVTLTFFFNK